MSEQFIGSLVSLDCGKVLGTYQGQIVNVDPSKGKITLINAYQNGIACCVPKVTLSACDIYDLRIVKNASEVQQAMQQSGSNTLTSAVTASTSATSLSDVNVSATSEITSALRSIGINITPSVLPQSIPVTEPSLPAPIYDVIISNSNNNCIPVNHSPERSKLSPSLVSSGKKVRTGTMTRAATVTYGSSIEHSVISQYMSGSNGNQSGVRPRSVNGKKSPPTVTIVMGNALSEGNRSKSAGDFIGMTSAEFLNSCMNPTKREEGAAKASRNRTTSASEQLNVQSQVRKTVTPRKDRRQMAAVPEQQQQRQPQRRKNQQQAREDCFAASVDEYVNDDFDFESNLAMFNKQAVFEEIEKDLGGELPPPPKFSEAKYRCDENILPSSAAVYRQIRVKTSPVEKEETVVREYITDLGLIVPSITSDTKRKILERGESVGFTREKRMEMLGRSAAEMSLQLLGGATRFNPKNGHQLPVVVLICTGGMRQAALGLCCARHLAARSVSVTVLVSDDLLTRADTTDPEFCMLETERSLFLLSDGVITSNICDLPRSHVDLIITSLGSSPSASDWLMKTSRWANDNKAQILAVDPPTDGAGFISKWCLTDILPLCYKETACGQVHLCDICLPARVLEDEGLTYQSPFAHKFIIPLYVV